MEDMGKIKTKKEAKKLVRSLFKNHRVLKACLENQDAKAFEWFEKIVKIYMNDKTRKSEVHDRCCRIVRSLYLSDENKTIEEIAKMEYVHLTTAYKNVDFVISEIAEVFILINLLKYH